MAFVPNPWGGGIPYGGKGGLYGGPKKNPWEALGQGGANNPWQSAMWNNYNQAQGTPYGDQWKQAVAQAMKLGNRDFEGDMRRFATEDMNREQGRQQNRLQSMGMSELSLQRDVQDDWAKRREDAGTRASISAQGMKTSALEAMRGMLGSASGVELDRLAKAIAAAQAGGGNYNDFMSMLIPLMEKLGYNTGR